MTMSRRLLCASIVLVASGCGSDAPKCALDPALAASAGPGATDCGLAPAGGDSSVVDACVLAAFSAVTPFVARYERQGIDSHVVQAIAGDSKGGVVFFFWDSAPCGGPDCGPKTTRATCENPSPNTDPSGTPQWLPLMCTALTSGQACG
jgi:hypothetical protein